ncbi:MAG: TIGR00304 family membrane protein [Nitrososphaeria archaeon]
MRRQAPKFFILFGMILCIIGFMVSLAGALMIAPSNVSAGGVVFIGPFPIVFGSGQYGIQLMWLGLAIALIMILASYTMILHKRMAESSS